MIFKPPIGPTDRRVQGGIEYRLYFLDGTGHIHASHEFEAEDDDDAIKIAQAWREGRRMELWQRFRMVKRWE